MRLKRYKCLIRQYWKDTGTYERKIIPIEWESDQLLNIRNSLNKTCELMFNTKYSLSEAVKIIFPENNIPNTYWSYLKDKYNKYIIEFKI